MFPCSKGHSVRAYLDTFQMTLLLSKSIEGLKRQICHEVRFQYFPWEIRLFKKLRFSEKATKFVKNLPLGLDIYSVTSKPNGRFFPIFSSSQNKLTIKKGTFWKSLTFTASDAVISMCGHLFCWPCLHQWLETRPQRQICPVCKAGIGRDKVVPLYGRDGDQKDPREKPIPPR